MCAWRSTARVRLNSTAAAEAMCHRMTKCCAWFAGWRGSTCLGTHPALCRRRSRWSMPEETIGDYSIVHGKARSFYDVFERKGELQHQTHYCPGCGHGTIHKMLARAIDELGIQDRTILISPVGCSVFAYYYFDVGNIQAAHGRAPAVATAAKSSQPHSIVVSYQG